MESVEKGGVKNESADNYVTPNEAQPLRGQSELTTRRLKRFRQLVDFAYDHSPYYKNLIDELNIDRSSCVPGDFPELTKSRLMANFDEIITDPRLSKSAVTDFLDHSKDPRDRFLDRYTVMHTSGTSGVVGYFLFSPADRRRMARGMLLRRRQRAPASTPRPKLPWKTLRRLRIAFYGATGGHFAGVTAVARLQQGLPRLLVDARSFEVNSPLSSAVEQLNTFQPDLLFGYTTALKLLAEQQNNGRLSISPRAVAATGETVTRSDMKFLSASFDNAWLSSAYACTEHMMMGYSNPDGETMTLVDENLLFELYDDHTLVTNLFNFTMPLIRYRMSDILEPVSAPGTSPIIVRNLVGRCEKMPDFLNARGERDFISPHTINEIFVRGVSRFQLQITGDTSFDFPICIDPGLNHQKQLEARSGVEKRLGEILREKGLDNVTANVQVVNDIPVNRTTRKFQLIVDRRAIE